MYKDEISINALRMLGIDMVNRANSGHPGIVLGAAPMLYTLYTKHLAYNPQNSKWTNRDRFILSAGHGSALLYAMLHFNGYGISMDDLKSFRQWGSRTPGHPEYGCVEGIEATTGPLGQGMAMATGMAIAESYMRVIFNKPEFPMIDHYTYVLCGDGDLQEGITQETMSLAGHLRLDKLIVLYDSNDIQLDGPLNWSNTENVKLKYESMNWQYILIEDGENIDEIDKAIVKAKENQEQPTIIEVKTVIGHGSPLAGQSDAHGASLGESNTKRTKESFNWPYGAFEIPDEVYGDFKEKNKIKGLKASLDWVDLFKEYELKYPEEAGILKKLIEDEALEIDFEKIKNEYQPKAFIATRSSSGEILKKLQTLNPLLIGGSADLTKSTKVKGIGGDFTATNNIGRNINFGVREHAMAGITNGLVLHGLKGFCGSFFVFSDYMKPAIRLAALMEIPSIFVFTHDSIAVGEDGPTHEPIEQLAGLRAVPNLDVIRPADANEAVSAWELALVSKKTPTVIVLTRQNVETLNQASHFGVEKGGYIISNEKEKIDAILIATGSEVALAIQAQNSMWKQGIDTRVVSLPSFKRFKEQETCYRESVLPLQVKNRLAIEMGSSLGWGQFVGLEGASLTIEKFGASAKGEENIKKYGFNVDVITEMVQKLLGK